MINTNKHIKLLIGLPGSGKSYWLEHNVLTSEENIIFDDISQTDPNLNKLTNALNNPCIKNIYIADVNLINIDTYLQAKEKIKEKSNYKISFSQIVFIGDFESCKANVELRADGRNVKGTLERFKNKIEKIKNYLENDRDTKIIQVENYLTKLNNKKFR